MSANQDALTLIASDVVIMDTAGLRLGDMNTSTIQRGMVNSTTKWYWHILVLVNDDYEEEKSVFPTE